MVLVVLLTNGVKQFQRLTSDITIVSSKYDNAYFVIRKSVICYTRNWNKTYLQV